VTTSSWISAILGSVVQQAVACYAASLSFSAASLTSSMVPTM
jgi:hypothetical protein